MGDFLGEPFRFHRVRERRLRVSLSGDAMTDAREIIAEVIQDFRDAGQPINDVVLSVSDDIISTLTAAGYRILGPGEVTTLQKALSKAEDGAGTLPAREAVKLRPADWHALCSLVRALGRKA